MTDDWNKTRKILLVFSIFEKNKLKVLLNWINYYQMWLILFFLFLFGLIVIAILRNKYYSGDLNIVLASLIFAVLLPVTLNKLLLVQDKKSDSLLLSVLDKSELLNLKQIQTFFINLILYFLITQLIIPDIIAQYGLLFIIVLGLLILHGIFYPSLIKYSNNSIRSINTETKLWLLDFKPDFLPVRGILARDWSYFKRMNKFPFIKHLFYNFVINFFLILFITNNELPHLVYFAFFFQYLIIILSILDLPNDNNRVLLESNRKHLFPVLSAQTITWLSVLTMHFIIILLIYRSFVPPFSIHLLLGIFLLVSVLLIYGLLIRNTYFVGVFYFLLSLFLPFLIPIFIYRSIRKVK